MLSSLIIKYQFQIFPINFKFLSYTELLWYTYNVNIADIIMLI